MNEFCKFLGETQWVATHPLSPSSSKSHDSVPLNITSVLEVWTFLKEFNFLLIAYYNDIQQTAGDNECILQIFRAHPPAPPFFRLPWATLASRNHPLPFLSLPPPILQNLPSLPPFSFLRTTHSLFFLLLLLSILFLARSCTLSIYLVSLILLNCHEISNLYFYDLNP